MDGLLGLSKSIRTNEDAHRDLAILEKMDARLQQDRNAEVVAQQQEQLLYERLYQMSDQLLEKDRKRINKRFQLAQSQIKEHIRANGGSRRRFMEQGGLSAMNSISNDLMRSPEAIQYQENKKNLTKILELQEKGLGHLISKRDLKSLENYENNPDGGPITYSGVLAEVEIPPSANFDYGTDIPIEKILSHGSNMMKIKANYEMTYPEKGEPNYAQLIAFAKEMGYGGTGSNTTRLRLIAQEKARKNKENKNKPTKKDTITNSYLNQLNVLKSQMPDGLTTTMINEKYNGNLIEALKSENPSFNKLLSGKFTPISRQRNLSEEGIDMTDFRTINRKGDKPTPWEWMFNEKVGLKEGYQILPHNSNEVAQRVFDTYEVKNGEVINFMPTEDMYRMDGVKITGDNKLDKDDHTGNYKILGVSTALKAKMASDDTDALLINAYDDDGELDAKATAKIDEAYGNSEAKMTTVVALENEAGDIFYKEIDISQPQIKTVFSNALGDDDDITETVQQENTSKALMDTLEGIDKDEEIRLRGTINRMENEVFQDPMFEQEGEKYWGAYSAGQENRYPLMKAFYMAFDYVNNNNKRDEQFPQGDPNIYPSQVRTAIDNNLFTTSAIHGDIEADLTSYEQGNKEEDIIFKWLQNINSDLEEGTLGANRNQELAAKWLQMLQLMRD